MPLILVNLLMKLRHWECIYDIFVSESTFMLLCFDLLPVFFVGAGSLSLGDVENVGSYDLENVRSTLYSSFVRVLKELSDSTPGKMSNNFCLDQLLVGRWFHLGATTNECVKYIFFIIIVMQ